MPPIGAVSGILKGARGALKSAGKGAPSLLAGTTKAELKGMNPIAAGGLIGGGALFAGQEIGAPIVQGVQDRFSHERLDAAIRHESTNKLELLAEQAKMERLQASIAENMARLAHADPDLYNQVMAGRRLPRGARVFGGRPRTDLLQELGAMMATGSIQPEPSADQLLFEEMMNVNG